MSNEDNQVGGMVVVKACLKTCPGNWIINQLSLCKWTTYFSLFPLFKKKKKWDIVNTTMHLSLYLTVCLSICLSCYLLLNQRVELSKTCYITSPHIKGVRLCIPHPSICLSHYLLLNHWVEFNQTCSIFSSHGKVVWEQHYFSMLSLFIHLSVKLSPPKPLVRIQPNLLHHFQSW